MKKHLLASALLALPWATSAAFGQGQPALIGPDSLKPGAAAANLATSQVSPTEPRFGAKCDGTTVDSAAFTASMAAGQLVTLPSEKTCIISDFIVNNNAILDCNGSILQAASGAHWIVKKSGFNSRVRNCVLYDPNSYTMKTSTLVSNLAPGALNMNLLDASLFQSNMVTTIKLISGVYWPTKIWSVSGNNVVFADPIPSTINTVSIATAGTGYVQDTICVAQGGVGPPMTGRISVSGGGVTAFAPLAPGLYQTPPSSPFGITCPATGSAFGATLTATWGGAASGDFVDAAFGVMLVDNAADGSVQNLTASVVPVGVQMSNSGGNLNNGTNEDFENINVINAQMVGFAKFAKVQNTKIHSFIANGAAHHASSFGVAGIYIDGDWDTSNHCGAASTGACGGNKWDVLTLNFENGLWDSFGQLDTFVHSVHDTQRDYGVACVGCNATNWLGLWSTFTGTNPAGGHASEGVGVYFGNQAINDQVGTLYTHGNGIDVHFGDNVSAVWLPESWAPSKILTGVASSLFPGYRLVSVPTLSISNQTSPVYIAPGVASTTQGPSTMGGLTGNLTTFFATTSIAPGAATYQVFVYLKKWNSFTNSYGSWDAYGSCSFTSTILGCLFSGPAILIRAEDQIEFVAAVQGGGTFPANQTINIVADGI